MRVPHPLPACSWPHRWRRKEGGGCGGDSCLSTSCEADRQASPACGALSGHRCTHLLHRPQQGRIRRWERAERAPAVACWPPPQALACGQASGTAAALPAVAAAVFRQALPPRSCTSSSSWRLSTRAGAAGGQKKSAKVTPQLRDPCLRAEESGDLNDRATSSRPQVVVSRRVKCIRQAGRRRMLGRFPALCSICEAPSSAQTRLRPAPVPTCSPLPGGDALRRAPPAAPPHPAPGSAGAAPERAGCCHLQRSTAPRGGRRGQGGSAPAHAPCLPRCRRPPRARPLK